MEKSALQLARAAYQPKLPKALQGAVKVKEGAATQSVGDQEEIKKLFPNTYGMPIVEFEPATEANNTKMNVGIILSGGQAPGGHNVITGLFDQIKKLNPENRLFGFILGPGGLVDHNYMELTADIIDEYRNTGGFDMIGSGRTKLEKVDQFEKGLEIIRELNIKAIVIIGGDDSNTNACVLAEYYAAKNYGVQVIGCPKTIDGDLKNDQIETSFGFDTACKTYSELIGNIERDCNSARKYWHFIKVMGRSASHIALECALQTQPNICLVSEEIEEKAMSLDDIVAYIANAVAQRAADIGQRTRLHDVDIATGLADILDSLEDFLLNRLDFLLLSLLESVAVILLGLLELLVEFVQFSLGLFLLGLVHGALLLLVGIHLGLDLALHAFELVLVLLAQGFQFTVHLAQFRQRLHDGLCIDMSKLLCECCYRSKQHQH